MERHPVNLKAVQEEAHRQLRQEAFSAAVREAKQKILKKKWWHLPFRIKIILERK